MRTLLIPAISLFSVSLASGQDLPPNLVGKARDAIQKAGHPLYVTDLLAAIGKDPDDKDNKTSLSGSLAAYVRDGKIFTRPEPNTFELIERNGSHPRSVDSDAAQVDSKQERESDSP